MFLPKDIYMLLFRSLPYADRDGYKGHMTVVESCSGTGVLAGEHRMLIDGGLRTTASGALFDIINPATEEVAGQATDGTVDDMRRAIGAARRAFDTTDWSRDAEFRYHCLIQLRDALIEEKERIRRIVVTEAGSYFGLTSPLGGYRQSGLGRRNGEQGFEEYLELKTIGLPA
jgi:acyl-CoA reductase-like NAD-dependent aldehyde dehydrogenase